VNRKLSLILILIFLSFACAKNENKELPINSIKHLAKERKNYYNLQNIDVSNLNRIDSSFFKEWLNNSPINNTEMKINFNQSFSYYYFDYNDLENLFLFSIVQDDENGFYYVFQFTYSKSDSKIIQTDNLGVFGADGGFWINSILNFNELGNILTQTLTSTDDEDFDSGYVRYRDSIITKLEFFNNKTIYSPIDSLSRIDTIWTK